jgi:long-chain fatty acid transport protein
MGGLYMSGGGATMNYPHGSITTDMIALQVVQAAGGAYMTASNQSLKASSMYMTTMAGAAYSVSKNFSFSLGLRNVNATNKTEGGMTLTLSPFDLPDQAMVIKYNEHANGMGVTVGFNIDCNDKFNIAGRYESKVKLDFETEQIKDDFGMTTNGQLNRRDLPSVLALGFSLKAGEKIKTYGDFNYYSQKGADWGKSTMLTNEEPYSSLAGNVYSISAGFEYTFSPKLTGSFGGGFTNYLYENKDAYYTKAGTFEVMQDDNSNINAGIRLQASKKVALNMGYMHTFWARDQKIKALLLQPMDVNVKVNNNLDAVAVGVEIAF